MKKITTILLIAGYLMFNIGLTISFHYCGDSLQSISFFEQSQEKSCGMCGKSMKKNCCKDKTTAVKIQDNQQAPTSVNITSAFFKIIATHFPVLHFKALSIIEVKTALSEVRHSFFHKSDDVYLHNCMLII